MRTRLLGIFTTQENLLRALGSLRGKEVTVHAVYSPFQSESILHALEAKPSPVRFATLLGAMGGLLGGISLAIYTFLQWKFVTSGKPVPPAVPLVVVGFEMTILLGFLSTVVALWAGCKMPKMGLPEHYDPRFSKDRFGLLLECNVQEEDKWRSLLQDAGAEEVRAL